MLLASYLSSRKDCPVGTLVQWWPNGKAIYTGILNKETNMVRYVGILDGSDVCWGIRIPDLPGCHGGGETAEAAIEDATSAVREWAEHRKAKGAALPAPRLLAQIMHAGELDAGAGETGVMMPLLLDSGRPVRANLSLDAALLEAIDGAARSRGLTRSGFIASAARQKIIAEG